MPDISDIDPEIREGSGVVDVDIVDISERPFQKFKSLRECF